MDIAFLTCPATRSGSPDRRADAFEHDLQFAAIAKALAARGHRLHEIDWNDRIERFARFALVLIGTPWDYHENAARFLAQIEAIAALGVPVCNAPDLVRWNADKRYLRDLEARGAAIIPSLWVEGADARTLDEAFARFGAERLVVKRQVGLGAIGQTLHDSRALDRAWRSDDALIIQPFIEAIESEGELSFVFIDGVFSHALVKRARAGDYRVQSIYGGTETIYDATDDEIAEARRIVAMVPFDTPLYARIDMVRSGNQRLMVMEAEMIEPYLYPMQGPQLGDRIADAIDKRIARS